MNDKNNKLKKRSKKNNKKDSIFRFTLRKFLKGLMFIGLKPVFWLKVEGKENLKNDAAIVCGNHLSILDPLFILINKRKNVSFFSKKELKKSFFGKMIIYAFKMIPTNRDGNDTKAIKEGFKALDNGEMIGIYPEGTRHGLKDNQFNSGAIYISVKKNVPIIPVGLSGEIKPFKKITMKIGKPINFKTLMTEGKSLKDKDEVDRLTKILLQEIMSLTEVSEYPEIKKSLKNNNFKIK